MHPSLGRRLVPAVGLLAVGLVVGVLSLPAASADDATLPVPVVEPVADPVAPADPVDPAAPVVPAVSTDAATEALSEVQDILDDGQTDGRDLTMALRDLRLHRDELSRTDRSSASKVLRRPLRNSAPYADFGPVRVHWKASNPSITADWINLVGTTSQNVLATYAAAGYRAPKTDARRGGSAQLDIYVVALDPGLYGYCDTDAPPPANGPYDVPAYCAFDDNYLGFPGTPTATLQVTAAHELFHAVQFAYDYEEDRWFLEATATWAEDQLFDDVNDNWQYLAESPLRQPRQSLDQWSSTGLRQYGEWIFFRYLTERWPQPEGTLPVIIKRLMQRVDGARGGPDNYSMQAIERELASKHTSVHTVYAEFADANRRPALVYEEGASYKAAPPSAKWTLSARHRDTGKRRTRVNHLASATARLVPGAGVTGDRWRLRVQVDLPDRAAAAVVSSYRADGVVKTKRVRLDRHGRGKALVRFDGRAISYVEVTLVNTSTRYKCWSAGPQARVSYSCRGRALDDHEPMTIRARAVR